MQSINTNGEIQNSSDSIEITREKGFWRRAWEMYRDGFRNMTWGRTLWILIAVKLFIMFAILKLFFFPNFLSEKADTDEGKSSYVANELVERVK